MEDVKIIIYIKYQSSLLWKHALTFASNTIPVWYANYTSNLEPVLNSLVSALDGSIYFMLALQHTNNHHYLYECSYKVVLPS